MDSGAFSAKTQGIKLSLDTYIAFIKQYSAFISVYANLDVIGDPDATWKNQQLMEKAGLHPLPCYHLGESYKWLQHYCDQYDYVAIGGMVGNKNLGPFLDHIFHDFICDSSGFPRVKTHSFGLTSNRLVIRYPWYSVDAITGKLKGFNGLIYVPQTKPNGDWDYLKRPYEIGVSWRQPDATSDPMHFDNMSPLLRAHVERYLKQEKIPIGHSKVKHVDIDYKPNPKCENWCGPKQADGKRLLEVRTEDGVRNSTPLRDRLNIRFSHHLQEALPPWPWAFKADGERQEGLGL